MDLAVNLRLFVSRCEELSEPLSVPRKKLIPVMTEMHKICTYFTEQYIYMNELRNNANKSKENSILKKVSTINDTSL